MSTKLLRYRIIESIKLLASEGTVQLSCYSDFVCKGDEIACSLADWLLLYKDDKDYDPEYAFQHEELALMYEIKEKISSFYSDDFSDYAILHSPKWERIRDKAKKLLNILNVEYSLPDKIVFKRFLCQSY